MQQVLFFDTTCRDGKQAPGNNHGPADTVRIARQAAILGINIFEAGFAVSSELDFESVRRVATEVEGIVPCSLARAKEGDIISAAKALERSLVSPRIHTFIGTSPTHLEYKLKITQSQALEAAIAAVAHARRYVDDVEFSAEDAMRTDFEFLKTVVREVILAGARTVNLPDTVGYRMPEEIADTVKRLITEVPEITQNNVVISVHCHNDLGCATANTLAGVVAGARQVECTINGIGERAGNTHFAEVAMALEARKDYFGLSHSINTKEIGKTARLVSAILKKEPSENLPIVGQNVFAHGSGIHQHGMSGNKETYEIMKPESVGWSAQSFPLSSQSGRRGLQSRLQLLGYELEANELSSVYEQFIKIAQTKDLVSNNDLHLIMQMHTATEVFVGEKILLTHFGHAHPDSQKAQSTISIGFGGVVHEASGESENGPVDAAWSALQKALACMDIPLSGIQLVQYELNKGQGGTDAMAQAHVAVSCGDNVGFGFVEDKDIVTASITSLVMALNHVLHVPVSTRVVDV